MHINLNRITQQLNEEESIHIEECEHCRDEYNLLLELRKSAEKMQLLTPDDTNWQTIVNRLNLKTDKQPIKQLSWNLVIRLNCRKIYRLNLIC